MVDALDARVGALEKRMDKCEVKIDELEARTIETSAMIKNIDMNVSQVKRTLDKLLDKPAERWDIVIAAVLSGAVAFLMAQIGIF